MGELSEDLKRLARELIKARELIVTRGRPAGSVRSATFRNE